MKLISTIPILVSTSLDATEAFYHALGFETYARYDDYLTMHCKGVELHFVLDNQSAPTPRTGAFAPRTAYCRVTGVDEWFAKAQALGAQHLLNKPTNQFYGIREFSIKDPAGNVLHLGENLPQ
jgi:uncharacterized glyoxalase superfamily protein PhnB